MSFAAAHDRHMDPPDLPDWDVINEQAADAARSDISRAKAALHDALAEARRACERHGVDPEDCGVVEWIEGVIRELREWKA